MRIFFYILLLITFHVSAQEYSCGGNLRLNKYLESNILANQQREKLEKETHNHYKAYAAQMDSINIVFEEIKFSIEQLEEVMTRKIDRVKDNVNNLEDSFESYKRSTNRTIRELKRNISTVQDDIKTLNEKVFPPAEENDKNNK